MIRTAIDLDESDQSTDEDETKHSENYTIIRNVCKLLLCKGDNEAQNSQPLHRFCVETFHDLVKDIERDQLYSQNIPTASKVLLTILLAVIMVLSLCGNTLVVMTFVFNKHMRSVTNVFISSLAISDLMVTFTCIPINMGGILKTRWIFGAFGCKLIPFIEKYSVACSSLTLCCIAFDRYYAIVHPLKLKFIHTVFRASVLQATVWTISAVSAIPNILFYDTTEISACKEFDEEPKEVCVLQHYETARKIFDIWVTTFILFFGPFFFMTVMYAIICYKLWIQRPVGMTTQTSHDARLKLKRKAIKMLITVVFILVICWSPLLLFIVITETHNIPINISTLNWRSFLQCLAISSTCWNPLVYAFMNEKFRKAFSTLLTCKKGQVHPIVVRNNFRRASTDSRKTTTQLELPALPTGSRPTTETKA